MLALSADWWHDVAMHIDGVPNRTSRPTYLLRESYREGKKVRKRTLANLSSLSDEQIESIRAVLAGHEVRPVDQLWDTVRSRPHGAVQAVRVAMQKLGFESLIASRGSAEREVVCAGAERQRTNLREHRGGDTLVFTLVVMLHDDPPIAARWGRHVVVVGGDPLRRN